MYYQVILQVAVFRIEVKIYTLVNLFKSNIAKQGHITFPALRIITQIVVMVSSLLALGYHYSLLVTVQPFHFISMKLQRRGINITIFILFDQGIVFCSTGEIGNPSMFQVYVHIRRDTLVEEILRPLPFIRDKENAAALCLRAIAGT
ncbi:hypothetical protein D3C72_1410670 [compost metagenome]